MCVHNLSTFQHLCSFRYLLPSPFLGPSITLWLHSISQPKAWLRGGGTGWAGLPAVRHTGGCGLWASKCTRQHAKVPKESGHGGRLGHCDGQFSVSKAAARTWSRTCPALQGMSPTVMELLPKSSWPVHLQAAALDPSIAMGPGLLAICLPGALKTKC